MLKRTLAGIMLARGPLGGESWYSQLVYVGVSPVVGQFSGSSTTVGVTSSQPLQSPREEWVMPLNSGKVQFPVEQTKGRLKVEPELGVVRPARTALRAEAGRMTGPT